MEVASAVKPSTGSAFSIDSIMSKRDKDRDRDSLEAGVPGTSRDTERGLSVPPPQGSSSPPSAAVSTSCACPVLPLASWNGNGLHPSHLSLSVSAATEAALMHNREIAAAAIVQNAHTLHTQQQQAAAMAGLSALDPDGSALTAGGVGTIPTLPSFSTLTHHPSGRGLAVLQTLFHKIQGLSPSLGGMHGMLGMPDGTGGHLASHHRLGNSLAGLGPKHVLPFYSWFSRPGGYWAHRLPGKFNGV